MVGEQKLEVVNLDSTKIKEIIKQAEDIRIILVESADGLGVDFVREKHKTINRNLLWDELSPRNLPAMLVHLSVKNWWTYDIGLKMISLSRQHFNETEIDKLQEGLAKTERELRKMRISRDEWRNDYGNLKTDTK